MRVTLMDLTVLFMSLPYSGLMNRNLINRIKPNTSLILFKWTGVNRGQNPEFRESLVIKKATKSNRVILKSQVMFLGGNR